MGKKLWYRAPWLPIPFFIRAGGGQGRKGGSTEGHREGSGGIKATI